jgi:hypothetical protein
MFLSSVIDIFTAQTTLTSDIEFHLIAFHQVSYNP